MLGDLLPRLDRLAEQRQTPRAEVIRALLRAALDVVDSPSLDATAIGRRHREAKAAVEHGVEGHPGIDVSGVTIDVALDYAWTAAQDVPALLEALEAFLSHSGRDRP